MRKKERGVRKEGRMEEGRRDGRQERKTEVKKEGR